MEIADGVGGSAAEKQWHLFVKKVDSAHQYQKYTQLNSKTKMEKTKNWSSSNWLTRSSLLAQKLMTLFVKPLLKH
uniref:Uncharacterized protein n=1 Tax=Romanomermis culicivorax TaxID=13658 RepID=A0A915KMF5_ROMCU